MKEDELCEVCGGTGIDPAYNGCSDPDCCYQDDSCWECGGTGLYHEDEGE